MKADKTYVYKRQIYLKGAEMPKGWKPPRNRESGTGSLVVNGPEGRVAVMPATVMTPGRVKPPVLTAEELAGKDKAELTKLAASRGLTIGDEMEVSDLVAALTTDDASDAAAGSGSDEE